MGMPCDPCDCTYENARSVDTYRAAVLAILCGVRSYLSSILNAVTGSTPPVTAAVFAPASATGFAAIGAGYALGVDLPDGTRTVILDNQTNGDVWVSMDGGAHDTFHLKGGDKLVLPLSQSGVSTTAVVHLKDGTSPSTAGTFYIYSY